MCTVVHRDLLSLSAKTRIFTARNRDLTGVHLTGVRVPHGRASHGCVYLVGVYLMGVHLSASRSSTLQVVVDLSRSEFAKNEFLR